MVSFAARVEIDFASFDRDVLYLVLLAAGMGAIGGLARFARLGRVPSPAEAISAMFLGAVAAIAAGYFLDSSSAYKFIAACILAGYAAPAVLDGLAARLKIDVAKHKADRATEVSKKAVEVAKTAVVVADNAIEGNEATGKQPSTAELSTQVASLEAELVRIQAMPKP
ncbi:MAG: hypothetical protein ACKV2T_28985 [Kofleriaceae bacterium]